MSLFDDIAKRFSGRKSVAPTVTAGSQGEDWSDPTGYVGGGTTAERSYKLRGPRRYVTYAELLNNTVIAAAGVRYFLNLIANAEWTFQPAQDEDGEPLPGAEEAAAFVREAFTDMESSWAKVIRRAARFRFVGYWTAW